MKKKKNNKIRKIFFIIFLIVIVGGQGYYDYQTHKEIRRLQFENIINSALIDNLSDLIKTYESNLGDVYPPKDKLIYPDNHDEIYNL